jgi:hypothetical protein
VTYWHLLWMFVTALGIIALGLATPFVWAWAREYESPKRAWARRVLWWAYDLQQQALQEQRLRGCLYCGTECTFGPNCANHDLAKTRERIASGARLTKHRFKL